MNEIDNKAALLKLLKAMERCLFDCVTDYDSRRINFRKASDFSYYYSLLKTMYNCKDRQGAILDKYLSDQTGIYWKHFSYLRVLRNSLCHVIDTVYIDDVEDHLKNLDMNNIIFIDDFKYIYKAKRSLEEMIKHVSSRLDE